MRAVLIPLSLFLGVAVLSCAQHDSEQNGADTIKEVIPWRPTLAAARTEAQSQHKVILIDFFATWCGPCKAMARTTWADPKVASALGNIVPVQIDVDKHEDIARQYGVEVMPTLMLVDAQGTVIRSYTGGLESDELIGWVNGKQPASQP